MSMAKEEKFEGTGGLNIFFRSWRPAAKTRGVVVIAPGFNSHSGYYCHCRKLKPAHIDGVIRPERA